MTQPMLESRMIPVEDILVDDDFNCRGKIIPLDVQELAEDILKNGQLQPCVVRRHHDSRIKQGFKLVAGFRRMHANKLNKATEIACVIREDMSEVTARLLNLGENLKRQDLNILQEARALERLYEAGLPREDIARQLGKSGTWVQTRQALLDLEPDIQEVAAAGLLNQQQIKHLKSLTTVERYNAVRKIKERKAKGETTAGIHTRRKPKPSERRFRLRNEVENMIIILMNQMGGNGTTRALAWAAGNISDMEFFDSLEKEYPKQFMAQVALYEMQEV